MYNKKTLTFTFHHYWGAFCQGDFVGGGGGGGVCPRPIQNVYVIYIFS